MDQKLIDQYMDELLFAQQGELDAVLMYNKLAEKVKDAKDAATFKQLAAEEGRHASVFHAYTKKVLQPKKTKAVYHFGGGVYHQPDCNIFHADE